MSPQAEQKMRSVDVEGVGSFDVPESWDESQVQGYLKAYRAKNPAAFKSAKPQKAQSNKLEPLPERGSLTERADKLGKPMIDLGKGDIPQRVAGPNYELNKFTDRYITGGPMPTEEETARNKKKEGSIGPRKRGTVERTGAMFTEGVPRLSTRTSTNPQFGEMSLASPVDYWSPLERKRQPITTAIDEFVGGLTSPESFALLVGSGGLGTVASKTTSLARFLPRGMSAAFGAQMMHQAFKEYPEMREAAKRGDRSEAKRILTHIILDATGGLAGAAHAIFGEGAHKDGQSKANLDPIPERPSARSESEANAPAENVSRGTIEDAAVKVGVTPEGIQHGEKGNWHQFTDSEVGGSLYLREEELSGKSPEEVEKTLQAKAEEHRKANAPKEDDSDLITKKRDSAKAHHEEFKSQVAESRAMAAPASQQPTPMPTVKQQRPASMQTIGAQLTGAWNQVANLLSPSSRGPHARATALSLREAAAKIAADDEHADHLLKDFRASFDRDLRHNPQAGMDWIDAYERGGVLGTMMNARGAQRAQHMALAQRWKQLQTGTWKEVQKREGMQRFIDQYFPHLFKDPEQAAQLFSRRPLEGPRSWRFKREFPTLKDAIVYARSQGVTLEPMYENPVDYMTAKLHEMNKYIHMHDFQEEMKAANIWKFSPDIKPPLGMARIDDPLGTVWGSPTEKLTLREGYDKLMFEQLNSFARSLGIDHIRKVKMRGGDSVWGYTIKGVNKVWTKHAGPEEVLTHELGHQLHFRYPELNDLIKDPSSKDELRKLADMRYEGTPSQMVSGYYKRYVRAGTEKIANLIHAYVHMRERGRKVAPNTFGRLDHIIEKHPELTPLREISPSLVLGSNTETQDLYVGRRVFGYYYAPESAARVTNNFLKPGLAGKPLFELARRPANQLNQVQLGGISFFHFTFTGVDAATSMFSLGLERISRGKIFSGLGAMARSNILTAPIETYIRGNKVLKEFYGTPQGQFYADTVNRLIKAGGRVKMDSFYHNSSVESFMRAWRRGNAKDALFNAVPAAVEAQAIPIMQQWVPRMKLGTFSLLAEEELAHLPPNANLWQQRGALARAWDSTDNRLGQLVYDNLFWNRTLKDLGLISVRSLGWNLGTIREIGGGVKDIGEFAATRGKSGMTPRMAYTIALPIVIGLHGAMMMYLMTGKAPQEPMDYFYPQTGRTNPDGSPERIGIPSYMRDEWAYGSGFRLGPERGMRQVATTIGHKMNPELAMVMEMLRNRDFYGTKIRNEDDPFVSQFADSMKYIGEQFEPFWLRNLEQRKQQEGEINPRNFLESMFGIQPAPRSVTRSKAEALAIDYLSERMPAGARTPEKAKAARTRGELIRQFRSKDPKMWANLGEAMKKGEISADDRRDIFKSMRMSPLQMMVQRLGLEQALNVYEAARGPEREQLKRVLRGKYHLIRALPADRQQQVRGKWDKIFGKPETELDDDAAPVTVSDPED